MCIYCTTKNYRKVYKIHFGQIPTDKHGRKFHIHHIDGNRTNNHYTNLQAVSILEHYEIHYRQKDWNACIKLLGQMGRDPSEISSLAQKLSIQYGWTPPNQKGKKYWTNGQSNVMAFECPGKEWTPGKTLFCDKSVLGQKISNIKKAEMTDEKRALLRQKSLDNKSSPPNQTGKKRWTNGVSNTMSFESPGAGWRPGITRKEKPHHCGGVCSSVSGLNRTATTAIRS